MGRRYRGRKPKLTAVAKIGEETDEKVTTKSAGYDPKTAQPPAKTPIAKQVGQAVKAGHATAKTHNNTWVDPKKERMERSKLINPTENTLFQILSTKRPAGTKTEEAMIKTFIDPLKPEIDDFGNRIVVVPMKKGGRSRTMFTCHTDTVHRKEGMQKLYLDPEKSEVFVDGADDTNCLGADDGTGIYIMLIMIKNRVPGTYIFHRAEEIGGQGSAHIRKKRPSWLRWFDRAIAFDRKGMEDVIITQSVGKLASERFGNALADELNKDSEMKFKNCHNGTFTDTANYYEFIGECINLSVGYDRQHTVSETQNIDFLRKLIPQLCSIEWEELPTIRRGGPAEPKYPQQQNWGNKQFGESQQRNTATPSKIIDSIPEKKLATLVMQEPRIALALLVALEPTIGDLYDAEWDVDQMDALALTQRFNDSYGGYGC